jgi:hypothetical protein
VKVVFRDAGIALPLMINTPASEMSNNHFTIMVYRRWEEEERRIRTKARRLPHHTMKTPPQSLVSW